MSPELPELKVDYAAALTALEQSRAAPRLAAATIGTERGGAALGRVRRVLGLPTNDPFRRRSSLGGSLTVLVSVAALVGCMAMASGPDRNPGETAATERTAQAAPQPAAADSPVREDIAWGKAAGGVRIGLSPRTISLDPDEKTFTVRVWYENASRKPQEVPVHKDANMYQLMFSGSTGGKRFYVGCLCRRLETIAPRPHPLKPGERFSETFRLGFVGVRETRFHLPDLKAGESLTLKAGWTPFGDAATAAHWNAPRTRTSGAITVRRKGAKPGKGKSSTRPVATQPPLKGDYKMGRQLAKTIKETYERRGLWSVWSMLREEVNAKGKEMLPGLVALVEKGDDRVVPRGLYYWQIAAVMLGRIGDKRASPFLAARLKDPATRRPDYYFVKPMGQLGVKAVVPRLVRWLREDDKEGRIWGIRSAAYGSHANYMLEALQAVTGKDLGAVKSPVHRNKKNKKQILAAINTWWAAQGRKIYAPLEPVATTRSAEADSPQAQPGKSLLSLLGPRRRKWEEAARDVNARQAGKLLGPAKVSCVGSSMMDVIAESKMVFVGKVVDLRWQKATVRRIKVGDMVGTVPETRRGTAVFECTQAIRGVKAGQRVTLDVLKDVCEFDPRSYLTEAMARERMFKDIQIKMGSQWLLCVSHVPMIDAIAYVPTGKEPIIGQVRQLLQLHAMPPEKQLPEMVNLLRQKPLSEGNPLVRYALDHVDDDPHRGRRLQTADLLNAGFLDKTHTPRIRYLMLHGLSNLVPGGEKTDLGEQVSLKIKRLLLEDAVAIQSAEKGLLRSYVHELAARFGLFEAPDASPVFPKNLPLTRLGGAAKALRSIAARFEQYAAERRETMKGIPADDLSHRILAGQIRDHLQKKDHCLKLAAGLEKHTASAISDLIKALSDDVATVRWKAAEALGNMGPSAASAIPALTNALSDEVDTVRWKAAEALGKMGPSAASAIPALIRASNNTGGTAEALGRIGPAAIPALIEALKEEGERGRYRAADALGRIGPKARSAVPALGRAMRDKDPRLAEKATYALAKIGPAAVPALLEAARDEKNKTLRRRALYSLGQVKPPATEAVAVLIDAVKDGQWEVAAAAAGALGDMGPAAKDAVPTLNGALIAGDTPALWQEAARALWEITPSGREVLIAALRHPALHVRRIAVPVLLNGWRREQVRLLGGPSERLTRTVARALSTALSDSDPEVRFRAAEGLGHMGKEAVPMIPQLIAMLGDEAKYYPIKTASRDRHGRPSPPPGMEVYFAAMGALTGIGAPAVAPLAAAVEKASPTVRRRIYSTLIRIAQHAPRLRQSVTAQLQRLTGQDIGPDMMKWIQWLVKQAETGKTTLPPVGGKVTTPNAERKAEEERKQAGSERKAEEQRKKAAAPSLADERKQLARLKTDEIQKQKPIVLDKSLDKDKRMVALYRIGELGTKQSADFLAHVYDHPIGYHHEQLAIVDMLWRHGPPQCVPLLLKASRHPFLDVRWHAARALARVRGEKAIPRLREMAANDPSWIVRGQVRIELARLGDRPTIASFRADIAAALGAVRDAGLTEAAPDALALCRPQSKASLSVKVRAAVTALSLGEARAVPVLAEYLDRPAAVEAAKGLGGRIEEYLKATTRQDFGADRKKWLAWWNGGGHRQPLLIGHVSNRKRAQIVHAAIAWGRSQASGPYIKQPVCYLERTDQTRIRESETLRPYTRPELKLLGKLYFESYLVGGFRQMGRKAFATLSRTGRPGGFRCWELESEQTGRADGGWTVVRAVERVTGAVETKDPPEKAATTPEVREPPGDASSGGVPSDSDEQAIQKRILTRNGRPQRAR